MNFDKVNNKKMILSWLKSDSNITDVSVENRKYTFMKYPYSEKINLLYFCYTKDIGIDHDFQYCGIYDKEKDTLYDIDYCLREALNISWNHDPYPSTSRIILEMTERINKYIDDYVYDNINEFYEAAANYNSDVKEENVYYDFITGVKEYKYECNINDISKVDVLKYLDDDSHIYEYSLSYIEKNKERIGEVLKDFYLKNSYIHKLENDKNNSIHKARDIYNILDNSNSVTVHVFVHKDNINFDFKYNTNLLKSSCTSSYISTYFMSSNDRKKCTEYFNYNDLNYKDIYKIEYRNKPIYEDKDFFNEKEIINDDYSL